MQQKKTLRSNKNVLAGKDGWLFLRGDSNEVIHQHNGRVKLNKSQLAQWRSVLNAHVGYCDRHQIRLCQLVVPDTHSVKRKFMPAAKADIKRPIHQILDMAKGSKIRLIYPIDVLAAKSDYCTYVKNDTHWSDYGAYITARLVLEELRLPDQIEKIAFTEQRFAGDLGIKLKMIYYANRATAHIKDPRATIVYDSRIHNIGTRVIYKNRRSSLPKCVVFGNSYALHGFLPILAEQFSETHFIFDVLWDYHLLEELQPDVVIMQYLERFMISVPDEKFQLKARCRAAIKIHENLSQASEMHLSSLTKGKRLGLSECFLYQAIIDLIRKDVKKAIRTFEKAVSIENNIDFFYVFAISLKLGHHYELAEPYLKKCCENDPSNRNFLTEYIHTLHKLKKWSLANKIHQELHSL